MWGLFFLLAHVHGAHTDTGDGRTSAKESFSPKRFQERVARAGGRVDLVFADERPFKECHASTLAEAPNGDLLCAWFGGTEEGHEDVGIWLSRFANGRWSLPLRIAKVNRTSHWNPVLFRDPDRGLFLFFKVGPRIPAWQTFRMQSQEGISWTEPTELVPGDQGGRGPVKNKPILLSDGAWLAGASTEYNGWRPFADRSEDGGLTWQRSANWGTDDEIVEGKGAIQPTLWESAPGRVHALVRTTCGRIGRADSTDSGKTWGTLYLTDLPNPNSGIDLERLEDGRLLLVYNPVSRGRTPLNLALSTDNGTTWRDIARLETKKGEYSYPAIVRFSGGIAVSYTWKRERIRCWQIPLAAL